MRVVSLLPSATELVCAVGARDLLVGVSHECDFPDGIDVLPSLTRPRVALPSSSAGIDRAVRDAMVDAVSIYEVDARRLRDLRPDVIVTQDLCDVCAVSADEVAAAIAPLGGRAPALVRLRPTRLDHVWTDVVTVGVALGRAEEAAECARRLRGRLDELRRRVAGQDWPRVLTIEWTDPVMVGGTWMPDLVEVAGGEALIATAGQPSPVPTGEELSALDPDVVLIKPCGYTLARALADIPVLMRTLPWRSWRAIRDGRLYVADGSALFNRSGPRLVESAEVLAAALHPELVPELRVAHAAWARRVDTDGRVHGFDELPVVG